MPDLVSAPSIANILAGTPLKSIGGMAVAPLGTVLPTTVSNDLPAGFLGGGFLGDDGLTETVDRSTDKIKAWGGDIVKVVQTDFSCAYQFTFIETLRTIALKTAYGDSNVVMTPPSSTQGTLHVVKINSAVLPHKTYLFDIKDDAARIRILVPDGQVTEVGEVTYSDDSVIGYQVTVEAFRDPALDANAIKYCDDGVLAA